MKKDRRRKRLFDDKRVVMVISFLLAFLGWVVVAGFINPGQNWTIPSVKIDYQRKMDDYKKNDLQLVTDLQSIAYADVMVSGDGGLISGLKNTGVTVYPDYSAVTSAGTYEVPLKAEKIAPGNYNILELTVKNSEHSFRKNPANTVTLTFEEVANKTFPVTVQADTVTAETGYFRDAPVVSHPDVTVTGPASEVAKVASVAAIITEDEARSETKIYTVPLTLLDAGGKELDSPQLSITPVESVEVTIPILEIQNVDLKVGLIGVPQGFDTEWLDRLLTLSTDTLQLIGTSQALAGVSNPYTISEIDLSELGVGWESDPITVELPDGVRSQPPSQQVVVRFNSSGLEEKSFRVADIRVVNAPSSTAVSPIADGLTVTLVGPPDQLEDLLPENIVVEVDAFGLTTTKGGQQALPARVLVPSKNRVFATGQYSLVCDIGVQA